MLGSPCSPCCSACTPDVVPSQIRWQGSWGSGLIGYPPGYSTETTSLALYGGWSADVVLTRNDAASLTYTGIQGYAWTFDGGPLTGPSTTVNDNSGATLWTISSQQYINAFLWVVPAALAPSNQVAYAVDPTCDAPCWFWGGKLSELYVTHVTPGTSSPSVYYLDLLVETYIGGESRKIGNPGDGVLYGVGANCVPQMRTGPAVFLDTIVGYLNTRASTSAVAFPSQYFQQPGDSPWQRFFDPFAGPPGRGVGAGAASVTLTFNA